MQLPKRKCLDCGSPIHGRADKKFCTEQCRNSYYNQRNRDANLQVRNINNILRKNRRILVALNPSGKCQVHRDRLLAGGFNFEYLTSYRQTPSGTVYYCYEHGYMNLEKGLVALTVKTKRKKT
ncbi:DUF2116 family Zn-ribbon domain-containing protein [Fulvivirgaceae bacterium BMA12]|uniref:DUF2116 family Zn-ribbon domain-containing protein n=1 Tax=Agaribacillus aureus TaxID=3051825 RepID=A0ABT8L2P4_9BACT|nr:DUF2116 family Zn-ribbon domain-containing protein [Fulvivirgaceae bacterium BMA12]